MICKIKEKFLSRQFIVFVAIGVMNTVNHNIFYLMFLNFFKYFTSNAIAFVLSLIISFVLNSKFTFKVKMTLKNFLMFPISYLPNVILQMTGLVILVETFGIQKEYAAFLASLIAIPFTFLTMKYLLKD